MVKPMANVLYLDCVSGISGDMFLSALIDLGLDPAEVENALASLHLPEHIHLHPQRQTRCGISGIWLNVTIHHGHDCGHAHPHSSPHDHPHTHKHTPKHEHEHDHAHGRSFTEIKGLIARSRLPDVVKSRAISVFRRLGEVEAAIHNTTIEEVHFHEVGAVDSILDIVGVCLGLHRLGIRRVLASPLVDGRGTIQCAHGTFPVPAPATLALLRGVPLTQIDVPHELITPTGAALLAEFAESFAPLAGFATTAIGYGLGTRDLPGRPNVLRLLRGTISPAPALASAPAGSPERVAVLTTNLDDLSPEVLALALDQLMALGALDVAVTPLVMKKGRPGHQLQVMTAPPDREKIARAILTLTTAAGLRWREEERLVLPRRMLDVSTPWGNVRVKALTLPDGRQRFKAEFEDCRRIAENHGIDAAEVARAAEAAALNATRASDNAGSVPS